MIENIILGSDSYKYSHAPQYPRNVAVVRSHLMPRGGPFKKVLSFGAWQYYAKELARPVEWWMVEEAEEVINNHMGARTFNRKGWEYIMREHGGMLPLKLRAVPEGYLIPIRNAMATLENTDKKLPWLTNFMETRVYPWYPLTIATLDYECRQIILKYLQLTGDPSLIDFKLHDFGYRGTTDSFDGAQAAIGGTAHLVNFKGTDTVPALMFARRYYNCPMAGFSIPASEHSTITSWGREHEVDAYENMLTQYPTGLVACVSDSYNIYDACEKLWGDTLRDKVLARDGTLVIRPDSGNPVEVVLKVLHILGARFGTTINTKGYKVLNPKVRVIQGDGVDTQSIDMILTVMSINGWSADNVAFGMGGALLQKVNRDTMKWAIKCNQVVMDDGTTVNVSKDPITDSGKRSLSGNLTLYKSKTGEYTTADRNLAPADRPGEDFMETFYCNGDVRPFVSLDSIREIRAQEELR